MQTDYSISSYDQFLRLYSVTKRPEVQRAASGIMILHNNLIKLVKEIFKNSPANQTERMVSGMMNTDANSKSSGAARKQIPNSGAKISFDLKNLSLAIKRVKDQEDISSGESFIEFLDDKSKETEQQQTRPQVVNHVDASFQRLANLMRQEDPAIFAARGYNHVRGQEKGKSEEFLEAMLTGTFHRSESDVKYHHPRDAWDLARCMRTLENYLRQKGRNDLTDQEKDSF